VAEEPCVEDDSPRADAGTRVTAALFTFSATVLVGISRSGTVELGSIQGKASSQSDQENGV